MVVHEGYRSVPQELIDQAMATGEAMLIVGFLASIDDIALIRLAEPVADVVPVVRHAANVRQGDVIRVIGKGATGNAEMGYALGGPNRTELRHAYNEITSAYGRWFCYRLDDPSSALPLEGALGNGDSGGPALIQVGEAWQLVGLAAWKVVQGHVLTARYGRYGEVGCNVRLSHYADWIESVLSAQPEAAD